MKVAWRMQEAAPHIGKDHRQGKIGERPPVEGSSEPGLNYRVSESPFWLDPPYHPPNHTPAPVGSLRPLWGPFLQSGSGG